jgi:hypothetical protein
MADVACLPQVLANRRADKQILLDCSYSRHIIVEFVAEPPVPNVYLGEEHIQSHLCSVRHKRTLLLSKGLPQASQFHWTCHIHAKIIFPLFAHDIFCFWIDFYRNVNFSAPLEAYLIAIPGNK